MLESFVSNSIIFLIAKIQDFFKQIATFLYIVSSREPILFKGDKNNSIHILLINHILTKLTFGCLPPSLHHKIGEKNTGSNVKQA